MVEALGDNSSILHSEFKELHSSPVPGWSSACMRFSGKPFSQNYSTR